MQRLWAPWRGAYVKMAAKSKGCFFCRYVRGRKDSANYVIERSKFSFSVLNLYPYNNGHVMVAPQKHVADLEKMLPEERQDLVDLLIRMKRRLKRVLEPDGFNIGFNEGRVAGAGLEGHLHIHVVPRWNGDTNFMPVIGETKVLPASLKEMHRKLSSSPGD